MSQKNKLQKFEEVGTFSNVIQPPLDEIFRKNHALRSNWRKNFFKNDQPVVLELGCGKGEYSIGLANKYPEKNFLGIDIKGARIWRGAKTALENNLSNVGFLRTHIELIVSFFDTDEIDEIWITFPDPQTKKGRNKKRLVAPRFLNTYKKFLKDNGIIHLKTDSEILFNYTQKLVEYNRLNILECTSDLYNSEIADDILSIKTHYEQIFLNDGLPIHYIKFELDKNKEIIDIEFDDEQ